jgi:hypothetical protein
MITGDFFTCVLAVMPVFNRFSLTILIRKAKIVRENGIDYRNVAVA